MASSKQEIIDQLLEFGFPPTLAEFGASKCDTAEEAIELLTSESLEEQMVAASIPETETARASGPDELIQQLDAAMAAASLIRAAEEEEEEVKMTVMVVEELAMSQGKMASQVAHAVLGANDQIRPLVSPACHAVSQRHVQRWDQGGQKIVVLRIPSCALLRSKVDQARSLGLVCCAVRDAGRTEVASGSLTAAAILGPRSLVDAVSGSLSLF